MFYLIKLKINCTVLSFYASETCSINDIHDLHNVQRGEVSTAEKQIMLTTHFFLFNSFVDIYSKTD